MYILIIMLCVCVCVLCVSNSLILVFRAGSDQRLAWLIDRLHNNSITGASSSGGGGGGEGSSPGGSVGRVTVAATAIQGRLTAIHPPVRHTHTHTHNCIGIIYSVL